MAETILVDQHPCVVWEIENIFSSNCIESDVFYLDKGKWKLDIYRYSQDRADIISIRVRNVNPDGSYRWIEVMPLVEVKNKTSVCETIRVTISDSSPQEIWSCTVSDALKESDTLKRKFYFLFTSMEIPEEDIEKATALEQLSNDLSTLFDDEESSDVVLKCGGQEIRAHKHILAARSGVFAAMFGSDMLEAQEGVVVIEDMIPDILDKLIRYIYSGKVEEMTMETICQMCEVADKYGIESLRDSCTCFMAENLSETVACDFLLLAEAHDDEELKNSVIAFMADRDGFLNTEEWNEFSEEHPAMAVKVYKRHVDSKAAKK